MNKTNSINSSSLFLVSGGAKGITSECVIKLAQEYKCKFILIGSSEVIESEPSFAQDCFDESVLKKRIMEHQLSQGDKPIPKSVENEFKRICSSRKINQTLSRIKQAGGKAEYISADVTNSLVLNQKVSSAVEHLGTVTGIIHGAGKIADKLIENKTPEDFEKVFSAKVKGLENLLSCVDLNQIEFLVLFSSVVGFYGNFGQTDYAIANEILNKSAYLIKQKYPQCHVVAINWGLWDAGMITPVIKKLYKRLNRDIIPIPVGVKMLMNELKSQNHQTTQVVIHDPNFPESLSSFELDNQLRSYRIRRQITLDANPFLYDHLVAGKPVLPATIAMSWMISACEQLYPSYKLSSCQNFKGLKGIIFDINTSQKLILCLEEMAKNNHEEIEFTAKIISEPSEGKILYHFSGNIKLVRNIPSALYYDNIDIYYQKNPLIIADIYSNIKKIFFHGNSFRGIRKVLNITHEKITVECIWQRLKDEKQGQFPLGRFNPYITDLSTHTIGIWLGHFYQKTCLPSQIEIFEQFSSTPHDEIFYVSTEIIAKTDTYVSGNIIIHDCEGKIYSRLIGYKFTIWTDV